MEPGHAAGWDAAAVRRALDRLTLAIRTDRETGLPPPTLLGIANGGITCARLLAARLGPPAPAVGVLDVSFYRDDIGVRPIPKVFHPTDVPVEVEGGDFLLVDDVLHSGRTIRAALEELFALGRPRRVRLAVLVDRGGRRLPIAPDYVGLTVPQPDTVDVRVELSEHEEGAHAIRLVHPGTTPTLTPSPR